MPTPKTGYSLFLINPKQKHRFHWDLKEICRVMRKKTPIHPLSLPTVAALTPKHYRIKIYDENIGAIPFRAKPDLVGITAMIPNITRAYEIADMYRKMGVAVVMGGPQASFNVDETLTHADAVIVGEAEGAWEKCLADFENNSLKPVYKSDTTPKFRKSPVPRWDLVKTSKVMALGVQVSRGCPFSCEFCLVQNMFGSKQRYRDIDDVIKEIKSLPKKQVTFTDDNLTANKKYARELMKKLKPLGISWMCQASIDLAEDRELLQDMAEAGCTTILFGIESLNPKSLNETHKYQNKVARYEKAIKTVHSVGINIVASFIVGFDNDTLDAFDDIYDFTFRNHLYYIMLNVLTVYPGTNLYEHMKGRKRLNRTDPDLLKGIFPSMRYKNMSQVEMFDKYISTMNKMFSYENMRIKALNVLGSGHFQKFNGGEISPVDKILSLFHLIRLYLCTMNRSKRRMFLDLFSLVVRKKACAGIVVETLLFTNSFQQYMKYLMKHREEILTLVKDNDLGPLDDDGDDKDPADRKSYVSQTVSCATTQ